jgi:type I restriction enzyme S subunit
LVSLPVSQAEQRRVAGALKDYDALIRVLEASITKKRAIKQGMMQGLLTGSIRLPGFTEPWGRRKLGELGRFMKGRGIRRDDVRASGIPCIRYGELYTKYRGYVSRPGSFVSRAIAETALELQTGDLLFTGSGETRDEIGICVAYIGAEKAVVGGDVVILRGGSFNPIFLSASVNAPAAARQKASLGQGDAVVHISSKALATVEIDLPPRQEQNAIAVTIQTLDAELDVLAKRLVKVQAIKQGMMQELLTGRTRMPLIEDAAWLR